MPILHRFRDINTYLPKIKMSRDLNHAHLGGQFVIITRLTLLASTRAQNLTILSSAISEIFKGCRILK